VLIWLSKRVYWYVYNTVEFCSAWNCSNQSLYLLQSSLKYQEYFLETLIQCICDKQPEVRQAASYGIGVMAMFGGEQYAHVYPGKSN